SPKIKKWLGRVVSGEAQDLCRHDKWLCMMYPRLKLLRELLRDEGVIFVSIDDNEQANIRILLNEIFGEENFICNFIWKKRSGGGYTNTLVSTNHDYILVYAKNRDRVILYDKEKEVDLLKRKYPLEDNKGLYKRRDLRKSGSADLRKDRPTMYYPIKGPNGKFIYPMRPDGKEGRWSVGKDKFDELLKLNEIEFVKVKNKWKIYSKERPYNVEGDLKLEKYETIWIDTALNTNARNELKSLFPEHEKTFDTPKPIDLIQQIIKFSSSGDDIILDSFAGSGTTGHAVMGLNKKDKRNRSFIMIEMEDDIADKITAERIKRAIKTNKYNEGFEFCELGKSLFDEEGNIEKECDFKQPAIYIYFTETQTNIDLKKVKKNYIGISPDEETEYYLLFKEKYTNKLTRSILKQLHKNDKKKVIYADHCLLSESELENHNIQFKQIPYEVKRY
ncbi:MAG: site-specific DNA-methyltransferase, partial [Candidatus Thorarchaeota archaeon]